LTAQRSSLTGVLISVFKTANTALEPALQVLPHPLDYALVVVTVGKIVIQRGEAVLLAGLLHAVQLIATEIELIDVAPIERGGIHGEAWRHSSVRANDHVILSGTAIPFAEAELSIRILHYSRGVLQHLGGFPL